ncbi:acyl-CoA dehydrogenase NM domain-like protein [Gymnopus androsaceus JB14]|uniref:Acyl-CoA dehydrogenase NM domain-like protein n=1 Tax=Gymnopus androsaceus JB14 TaxID=1447944 RepID=A0A6A4HEI4_9AGAR|nr:acyl-CoA dehydrogenase NM domain-like protein [Gymnopus androsaceus JB14]
MAPVVENSSIERGTELLATDIFAKSTHHLSFAERTSISLKRAFKIAEAFSLTREDIKNLSPKFWQLHSHPIVCIDGSATTLLTIHFNLALGTIIDHTSNRPELDGLIQDMLRYTVCGQFCLTEIDHGLDAINIETTATLLPEGQGYLLHTPHPGAAKFMPPTIPCGIPCVAVVFAQLIENNKRMGPRPFIVWLNDGKNMSKGVSARLLPPRGGSNPVNHAITSFNNVHLPLSALLIRHASSFNPTPSQQRLRFHQSIFRVAVGTLALAGTAIPCLARSAATATFYSQRRFVKSGDSSSSTQVPIMVFTTQTNPILVALAQSLSLAQFYKSATKFFRDSSIQFYVRHGVAAVLKVVAVRHAQDANLILSERCGAQGLFAHNGISEFHGDMRGIAIAEGDLLGLSIRLISEVLLGRYCLPASTHPSSPLSLHEKAVLLECQKKLGSVNSHRNEDFNQFILPRCQAIVEAIGHRMTYDAAVDAHLDETIVNLYMITAMKQDPGWYIENLGLTSGALQDMEYKALAASLPRLQDWIDATGQGNVQYLTAPIVTSEKWSRFVDELPIFSSEHASEYEQVERARL